MPLKFNPVTGELDKVVDTEPTSGTFGFWDRTGTVISPATAGDDITTTGMVDIIHTALESDDHALEIDCNAAGFGDVKALDIDYITGAIGIGTDEEAILVNIDQTLATGGDVIGLEVIATEGSAKIIGLEVGALVDPIDQISGAFVDMDSFLVKAVDQLAAVQGGGAGNVTLFVADNDTITIGDAAQFEEMEFILDTGASGAGIQPKYEFSTGVDTWTEFNPSDGTNGFRNTGVMLWLLGDVPTWAIGTGSEYLIRITRQRNSLSTTPIVDKVQIVKGTEYSWNKDGDLSVNNILAAGTITTALTLGSVPFIGTSGLLTQDNSNLFWDDSNNRLRIGAFPAGITGTGLSPLMIDVDINGTGFTVANSSTEYTRFISGSVAKGMVGVGNVDFWLQNGGDVVMRPAGVESARFDNSGETYFTGGNVGIGTTSPTAYVDIVGSTTSAASLGINSGTAPTSPNDGDIWNDSTQKALKFFTDGIEQTLSGVTYTQTADKTIANTVTETTLIGTGLGTLTLPANFLVVGKTVRVRIKGYHSSTGNPNETVKIKLGSTTIATMTTVSGNGTQDGFIIDMDIACRSVGVSGTVVASGYLSELHTSGAKDGIFNITPTTIDTTASQAVDITWTWGTASASNTITSQFTSVEILN